MNGNELKEICVYDEAGRYSSYTVEIEPFSPYSVSQYNRYQVVASEASKEQIEPGVVENRKEHSYDANMDTRWSAEGDGEWIIHDLGEKTFDTFGVAEWMGDRRKFYFPPALAALRAANSRSAMLTKMTIATMLSNICMKTTS